MSLSTDNRLYIPALGQIYAALNEMAAPILRIVFGLILMAHGSQKLFGLFGGMGMTANAQLFDKLGYGPGMFWGNLVGCTEFFGGLLLAIGLWTRPAALAVVIFMINAVYFTSMRGGFFWTKGGSEYSLLIGFVALLFLIRGAGAWSLDERIGREF